VTPLTAEQHVVRADDHEKLAGVLEETGQEWAAVTHFYAAYHLVSAALLRDPIFSSPSRLTAASPALTMADQHATRHQGYMQFGPGGRRTKVWGLNDLVALLYRPVWPYYAQLHEGSVDVRYGTGLRMPLSKIGDAQKLIRDEFAAGTLLPP